MWFQMRSRESSSLAENVMSSEGKYWNFSIYYLCKIFKAVIFCCFILNQPLTRDFFTTIFEAPPGLTVVFVAESVRGFFNLEIWIRRRINYPPRASKKKIFEFKDLQACILCKWIILFPHPKIHKNFLSFDLGGGGWKFPLFYLWKQ